MFKLHKCVQGSSRLNAWDQRCFDVFGVLCVWFVLIQFAR